MRQARFVAALTAAYMATVFAFSGAKEEWTARVALWVGVLLLDVLLVEAARFAWTQRRSKPGWYLDAAMLIVGSAAALQVGVLPRLPPAETGLLWLGVPALACAALVILLWREIQLPRPHAAPGPLPVWALAWVLIPLTTYLARNPDFFSVRSALIFLVVLLPIPLAVAAVLRRLEVRLWPGEIAVPMCMAFFYVFYSWPAATAALKMPVEASIVPQLGTLIVASVFLVALYSKARSWFVPVAVLLWVTSTAGAALEDPDAGAPPAQATPAVPPGRVLAPLLSKPDIYFLVYDGYAGSRLLAQFGVDNRDQEAFLTGQGFTIYDRMYSIALGTISTISRVLNISSTVGTNDEARQLIAGGSRVHQFLSRNGYETHYALNPYLTLGAIRAGHRYYPGVNKDESYGARMLLKGIATGEFKFDLVYDVDFSYEEFVPAKREMLSRRTRRPKFLYAHSPKPGHSQNSETCLPDEVERYASRLELANAEMRGDLDVLAEQERDAIIIIAGDHGPFLSGDCYMLRSYPKDEITALHLSDRYGTFLAIRWPSAIEQRYDKIGVLQDVFAAIIATLAEEPRLLRHRMMRTTVHPFAGAIKNGKVMIGPDKGARIY